MKECEREKEGEKESERERGGQSFHILSQVPPKQVTILILTASLCDIGFHL